MRFLILLLLAGCATSPVSVPHGAWRTKLAWHEIEDAHLVCREVLNETGRSRNIAIGCYKWIGDELHIFTRIARQEVDLCVVGHELFHGKAGHFHDANGNWVITR